MSKSMAVPTQEQILYSFCDFLRSKEEKGTSAGEHIINLICKIPEYGRKSACMKEYYNKLANLYITSLQSSDEIQPPPDEGGFMCHIQYTYNGNYSSYPEIFCGGTPLDPVAGHMKIAMKGATAEISEEFWKKYAVTLITDAIAESAGEITLNRDKLEKDIAANFSILSTGAASGYICYFAEGYEPTAEEMKHIHDEGVFDECRGVLERLLPGDTSLFSNLNLLMSYGGENTMKAQWIIFHLHVILAALGSESISTVMRMCEANGLDLPGLMKYEGWRNGAYRDWLAPICGRELMPQLRELRGNMPVKKWSRFGVQHMDYPLGYPYSFCKWGKMAWYS